MPEALDYKLYWNKGEEGALNKIYPLTDSTSSGSTFKVNFKTSGGIIGSEHIQETGGFFKFRVSYISKITGKES